MQTYLFYDIETTGLNKSFDQVLQFAAIRTDLNLKELERYELKVKLNPDVIPTPMAVITHRIGVNESMEGISEIDAIKQIHQWLNTPGTISLGYNTLGFDDEFLRFSFYRNLLPPYSHQFANQCGRMDIYPMAVMYYLFKNHVIAWPEKDGKPSLKLEDINHENRFVFGRSHDAMIDVEVTLELAQRFFAEKDMWDYLVGYFNKKTDESRIQGLQNSEGLMIDGFFKQDNFQCPVMPIGNHYHYSNQTLWLKLDSENLAKTTPDTIKENTRVMQKKLGEPSFVMPFKDRFLQYLPTERKELVDSNKKWLLENPDMFKKIVDHYASFKYPEYPHTDIDARLYLDGFLSREEQYFCQHFHAVNPDEKANMTERMKNPKLQMLAIRLLGRHYPDSLKSDQKEKYLNYLEQINPHDESLALIDFRGKPRLTRNAALNEINELRQKDNLVAEQRTLLDELEKYLSAAMA